MKSQDESTIEALRALQSEVRSLRRTCILGFSIFGILTALYLIASGALIPLVQLAMILGAIIAVSAIAYFGVRSLRDHIYKEPNQAPEPTPTAVTPPAGQEARQP